MNGVEGFIYPNEIALQWSVLIVLYPFITGLVSGAFILASLERIFPVEALKPIYRLMTLGSSNISEQSLAIDERVGWIVTLIGIPSAFLLHGYVGFIFGSVKANPWWSSPLMPVVFIFSAMVSGV